MADLNIDKIDFVYDRLQMDFNDDELMTIWNELDSTRKGDKQIYKYDELNYLLRNDTPTDIVIMTHHNKFDSNHTFIYYADDGRLNTAFILDDIPFFNHEDIAKYLINSKSQRLEVYKNEMQDYFNYPSKSKINFAILSQSSENKSTNLLSTNLVKISSIFLASPRSISSKKAFFISCMSI